MVPPPEPALVSDKSCLRDVAKNCIYIPERGGGGPVFQRVKIELIGADLPEEAAESKLLSGNCHLCWRVTSPWVVKIMIPPGATASKILRNHGPKLRSGRCENRESTSTAS